ncbi:MAG: energy transducer TonB, partial [Pseudomonadota bacterium]
MKRLLLAAVLAVALHGLLFNVEARWLKKKIDITLRQGPIAITLSPLYSPKGPSPPEKKTENLEKISVPVIEREEREPAKPKPTKKFKKATQPRIQRRPKEDKPPIKKEEQSPSPPEETESKTIFQSHGFQNQIPISEPQGAQRDRIGPDSSLDSKEDFHRESALPDKGDKPVGPTFQDIREAVPAYKSNPRPQYPALARRRGLEGTVVLEVLVSREGKVNDL